MASAAPRRVAVIGSTGSIGRQALEVVEAAPERFEVVALAAQRSVDRLVEQARRFHPEVVAVADAAPGGAGAGGRAGSAAVLAGERALVDAIGGADVVVNAVVGFAGLAVTVEALRGGKRLALANKESLVAGGPVVQDAWRSPGAELVPVDSEHGAIHQCLHAGPVPGGDAAGPTRPSGGAGPRAVARLVLTASGGPFRGRRLGELVGVSVEDALAHPTWRMGPKITVDSSTLMNKGLEVIEAHELFGIGYDAIEVLVHPQSIVHSMVEFRDGSLVAQLSSPDMRLPIGYAMGYPERLDVAFGRLDLDRLRRLDFERPDLETFSCLSLAYEAGRAGGSAPAWLNAANEVAVSAFLEGRLAWPAIAEVVASTLDRHEPAPLADVDDVLEADRRAREVASLAVERLGRAA